MNATLGRSTPPGLAPARGQRDRVDRRRPASGSYGDDRYRFARHAAAAARDRAAMERDRFRERLARHAVDAEHDQVVARLRRLR